MQAWAQLTTEMTLERVRRLWLEEGEPGKVKHDQVVWIRLWVCIFTHKNWYCHTAGLTVRLKSSRYESWSSLMLLEGSAAQGWLLTALETSVSKQNGSDFHQQCLLTACLQASPQHSLGGAVWGHRRHPAALYPVAFLPCFCHIDSSLANLQGKIHFWPKAMWTFNAYSTSQRTKLLEPRSSHQ